MVPAVHEKERRGNEVVRKGEKAGRYGQRRRKKVEENGEEEREG